MAETIDFGGYATRNNILCTDGLIIGDNAFAHNDGAIVPIFWQHQQNNISGLLGHGRLENRPDGVYVYGTFNGTKQGQDAKKAVMHGDVNALSIYANKLKKDNNVVTYGDIKEVSLVVSGANKGAYIDYRAFSHGEDDFSEGIIYTDSTFDMVAHADQTKEEKQMPNITDQDIERIMDSMTEEQLELLYSIAGEETDMAHSENENEDEDDTDKTVEDVLDTLTEEQAMAVAFIIEQMTKGSESKNEDEPDTAAHSENMEEDNMKTNAFETQNGTQAKDALMHAEEVKKNILADLKRCGSLREAFRAHEDELTEAVDSLQHGDSLQHVDGDSAGTYGITNIDYLFPDARTITSTPEFLKREDAWVSSIMRGVSHTPFSRIKTVVADITDDAARAKGYTKGHKKIDEVFGLLKRSTTPCTVYKKQKLDRDDVIDIVDFDVVLWLRAEMRMMLDEELARAVLIGDGRKPGSDDKINEQCIRPIYTDDELYTIHHQYSLSDGDVTDDMHRAMNFIRESIKSRKDYRGSGNPVLYTSEDMLTRMLLLTDETGRDLYDSVDKLKSKLRVSDIVTVPQLEEMHREVTVQHGAAQEVKTFYCEGIILNMKDYTMGADKGGAVSMMDDFDIDYNQMKYLIETRCSGALTRPKSAIVVEYEIA